MPKIALIALLLNLPACSTGDAQGTKSSTDNTDTSDLGETAGVTVGDDGTGTCAPGGLGGFILGGCKRSEGTGGGADRAEPSCSLEFAQRCRTELAQCENDDVCAPYVTCQEGCGDDWDCVLECPDAICTTSEPTGCMLRDCRNWYSCVADDPEPLPAHGGAQF